jgi:hypothetical protein
MTGLAVVGVRGPLKLRHESMSLACGQSLVSGRHTAMRAIPGQRLTHRYLLQIARSWNQRPTCEYRCIYRGAEVLRGSIGGGTARMQLRLLHPGNAHCCMSGI